VDLPDTYSPLPAETGDDAPPVLAETAPPESPEYFIPEEPADIVEYLDIGEPAGIGRLEPEEPPSAAARQTPEAGNSPRYAYTLVPAEERPPEAPDPYAIDPEDIISGIAAGEIPSPPPAVPQSAPASPFSVPLISDLERGGYYVQIAAHSRPELIESAISRIEGGYPLAVQSAGSADKPVYRILLGPLNLGESGAVLQRLKSIGYTDAFVRKN
jgi:hypothetical protein